jgi:hypothetical protein
MGNGGVVGVFEVRCKVEVYGTGIDTTSAGIKNSLEDPGFSDTLATALSESVVYIVRARDLLVSKAAIFPYSPTKFYMATNMFGKPTPMMTMHPTILGVHPSRDKSGDEGGASAADENSVASASGSTNGTFSSHAGVRSVGTGTAVGIIFAVGIAAMAAGCAAVALVQRMAKIPQVQQQYVHVSPRACNNAVGNYGASHPASPLAAGDHPGWHEPMSRSTAIAPARLQGGRSGAV